MRGKEPRGSRGRATIGDALSSAMRQRMAELKAELETKARSTIETQLKQPAAPWQRGREPSVPQKPKSDQATPASGINHIAPRPTAPTPKKIPVTKRKQIDVPEPDDFKYWELPPEAPIREAPPSSISQSDLRRFEELIANGTHEPTSPERDQLFVTIGLDFGTSSTKIIVRFPYEPGAPTIAIPAPEHCRCEGNPYLWQTVLWARNDGHLIAWPEAHTQLLYSLKQGVMGGRADTVFVPALRIRKIDAAAVFLAYVLRYVRGWLRVSRPEVLRRRQAVWFVNVGLPAENFDDQALLSAYRRTAAAALLMANFDGSLSVEVAQRFLQDDNVKACAESEEMAQRLGIAVIPETAAEATGFVKSTQSAPGVYLMVDVGATTLDVCAFRFWRPNRSENSYTLYMARVRPLGVEAQHWYMAQGKTEQEFSYQCDRCLWEVVWDTKAKAPNADCWSTGNDLSVFLVGGGAQNHLHKDRVQALSPWLIKHAQNDGIRLQNLLIPRNIDRPEPINNLNRLAVAWGLSYPPTEIGEFIPPSKTTPLPAPATIDFTRRYISKDQV